MSDHELLVNLNGLLERLQQRLVEAEEQRRQMAQRGQSTAYLWGRYDALTEVCATLETLVLEAVKP